MMLHRRFQLRRSTKMVAHVTTEPTHSFTIRVPESLYQRMKARAEELGIPQARLVVEGLKSRLENMDVTQPDSRGVDQENGPR